MKNVNIEAEGGELILKNKAGDYVIIPKDRRSEVQALIKSKCNSCIDAIVNTLPSMSNYAPDGTYSRRGLWDNIRANIGSGKEPTKEMLEQEKKIKAEDGLVISELYKQRTGKDWSTAKSEGLTTGSFSDNMKLRARLLSGELDNTRVDSQVATKVVTPSSEINAKDFNEAFKVARNSLGPNQIFEYKGKKYGTNVKGENFQPSKEVLAANNMNTPFVQSRLSEQNKMVSSVYSDKETVKLEPSYQDWETVKKRKQEINSMNQADIIREYNKNSKDQYLILDKKKGKLHLYKGDKEVTSYNVGTSANVGDEQTKTVVRNGKVYWNEGNKTTGAGIYEVSGVTPNNPDYSNAPSWNFKNEYGIEVPMAIHSSFGNRTAKIRDNDPSNNRLSTGCINGICYNLEDLYKRGYKQGQKLYVLPDDENNTYEISNGKLIFKSKNPNVNRTSNTLNYKPIKVELDEKTFREKVFTAFDINDEEEFNNSTKPFAQALADNKQKIMKAAKVNGDTYNDIAKIAFGIYGTESNFGDTHSAVGNLARAVNKYFNMGSSSSPDYKSKATTYGANKDSNSVGLTQIRFNMLDDSEKNILRELGITSNEQLLNPKDSAIATAAILATRYNNQLTDAEKKDIETYLPKKWNTRANYSERVKNNSQYLKIKELN